MTWEERAVPSSFPAGRSLGIPALLKPRRRAQLLGINHAQNRHLGSYSQIAEPVTHTQNSPSKMRITGLSNLVAALLCATTAVAVTTADSIRTTDIFAWPATAQSPLPFAKISYSWPTLNATVDSYTAPAVAADETVRIGVHRAADWVGVATSGTNFETQKKQTLRLYVDDKGEVWHVGFSVTAGKAADGKLAVEVVPSRQGPQVAFDKPIVVNQQGEVDAKEPEKSFLQKSVKSTQALRVVLLC